MSKTMRALGLMSGTSLDGIDVALIETDGEDLRYSAVRRARIPMAAFRAAAARRRSPRRARCRTARPAPGQLAEAEQELTERHAEAVTQFPGQRASQRPPVSISSAFTARPCSTRRRGALTVQIGDGPALARAIGIDVVCDLRAADVAAGGQGAPLAPVYHRALAARLPERPVAVLNIGGVANVTWIGRDGALIAFDTGPGQCARSTIGCCAHTGRPCDDGGATAAARPGRRGCAHRAADTSLFRPPAAEIARPQRVQPAEPVRASVACGRRRDARRPSRQRRIARAREHFPEQPRLWVICGGGRRNKTLMAMIAARVESAVAPAEAAGFDGDAVEAEAWAYMAVRSLKGLPITFPGTTGVREPTTGGVVAKK